MMARYAFIRANVGSCPELESDTRPMTDVGDLPLDAIIRCCQDERRGFYRSGDHASPCCVELFRRAFRNDQDAWVAIDTIFHTLLHAWVHEALHAIENPRLLDEETRAEVVQSAKHALSMGGPKHPHLVASQDPSLLLAFWRTCTKNATLMELRKRRSRPSGEALNPQIPAPPPRSDPDLRLALQQRVPELLADEDEGLVFDLRFVQSVPPREIAQRFPTRFRDVAAVTTVVQRLRRRFWHDPVIRDLAGLGPEESVHAEE